MKRIAKSAELGVTRGQKPPVTDQKINSARADALEAWALQTDRYPRKVQRLLRFGSDKQAA